MLLIVAGAFAGALVGTVAFGWPGLLLGSVVGVMCAGVLYFVRTEG